MERYRALQPQGIDNLGIIFIGVDEHLPSAPPCIIKQLNLDHQSSEMVNQAIEIFKQEAVLLEKLGKHPQIPSFLGYFQQNRQLYLVQDLVDGKTLAKENWDEDTEKEERIWEILKDLLPVLQFIHEHDLVHQDISPANIIRRHLDRKLVLIDSGIAGLFADNSAYTIDSEPYKAPEEKRGEVLAASDLYSLGVTCIGLLTGTLEMFDAVSGQWQWRDRLPPGTSVSQELGIILDGLVQPSLGRRYHSAAQVLEAIDNISKQGLTKIGQSSPLGGGQIKRSQFTRLETEVQAISEMEETSINYTRLKNWLSKKKWKEADRETWAILCQLAGKPKGNPLFHYDIKKLPREDLKMLDVLWSNYSKGRFGFSVQKRIYDEVGGEYNRFCDRIGWESSRSNGSNFGFNLSLLSVSLGLGLFPVGHLPSHSWVGGYYWWRHLQVLFQTM